MANRSTSRMCGLVSVPPYLQAWPLFACPVVRAGLPVSCPRNAMKECD